MTTVIWRYLPGPTDAAELVHVPCAPGETAWDAAERYFIEHPDADAALAVVLMKQRLPRPKSSYPALPASLAAEV